MFFLVRAARNAMLLLVLLISGCNLFLDADARVARANERIVAHDYNGAAIELRNALQAQPDHINARVLLAQVSLQLGDASGADKELRRAVEAGAPASLTAELAAKIRLELGQSKELLAQIDAGELPLSDAQRSLYRGYALLGLQQIDQALEAFGSALVADPGLLAARLGKAEVYSAQGKSRDAFTEIDAVLAAEPGNAEALRTRGTLHAKLGEYEPAQQALELAVRHAPGQMSLRRQASLLTILAEVQLAHGDINPAKATQAKLAKITPDAPYTRMLAGRIAMAEQNYPDAIAELQRVVTALPDLVSARFLLGAALSAQGNLNQAESHLAQVLQKSPENLEARKLLAQVRLRLERPDAAMQVLMSADAASESDPRLGTLMALARFQLGDGAGAIDVLERGVAAHPDDRQRQLSLAEGYLRNAAPQKAVDILDSMQPSEVDLRRETLLISAWMASKRTADAQVRIEQWLAARPKNIQLLNLASLFYARGGEFERSRALLERALAVKADDASTLLNLARVEVAAGNLSAAAGALERVLAVDPDNTSARLGLAEVAVSGSDLPLAEKRLLDLLKREPKAIEPRLLLARVQMQLKRRSDADKVLLDAVAAAPGRTDVVNAIGLLYLRAGRYDEAVARFHDASEAEPGNAGYWLNLARAQLALDHSTAAREALGRALAQHPDWIPAVGALALLDVRENKRDSAVARIDALKTRNPDDPAVFALEGDLNTALGQFAKAAESYGKAVRLRPDSTMALKAYRARKLGNLEDATAPLKAWLAQHPEDFSVRAVLADAYQQAGQGEIAAEHYELIVSKSRPSAVTLNNLAWLYHERRDGRAEETAKRAYEMAPDAAAIADTYGWILVQNGKVAEGVRILEQAAGNAASGPDIGYHYAAALARTGDHNLAKEKLAALLKESAGFASAAEARRLLNELSRQ